MQGLCTLGHPGDDVLAHLPASQRAQDMLLHEQGEPQLVSEFCAPAVLRSLSQPGLAKQTSMAAQAVMETPVIKLKTKKRKAPAETPAAVPPAAISTPAEGGEPGKKTKKRKQDAEQPAAASKQPATSAAEEAEPKKLKKRKKEAQQPAEAAPKQPATSATSTASDDTTVGEVAAPVDPLAVTNFNLCSASRCASAGWTVCSA